MRLITTHFFKPVTDINQFKKNLNIIIGYNRKS